MGRIKGLSVILPVLNEHDNLAELIPELCEVLSFTISSFEILVVDDSSTDGTDKLLTQFSGADSRVRYISRDGKRPSLPTSISEGVEAARYDYVAWMDADGSMPASTLNDLIASFESDPDERTVVVGSRFVRGGGFKGIESVGETPLWRIIRNLWESNDSISAVFLSRMLNRYLWLTLDRCCRDLASGFIITRKDAVTSIGLSGSYGDYCVRFLYLAHKMGLPLKEVPYVCLVRRYGQSKTGTTLWRLIMRGLPYVMLPFRIRRISRS